MLIETKNFQNNVDNQDFSKFNRRLDKGLMYIN